jgi:diguanylate cyclase (GGDEF)-like protein
MAKHSLRITARFALVLVVLVPALLAVMAAGFYGLHSGRNAANELYRDHLVTSESVTSLDIALEDAHQASLEILLTNDPSERQRLITQLVSQISPAVEAGISLVSAQAADDPAQSPSAKNIVAVWTEFQQLMVNGSLTSVDSHLRTATEAQVIAAFDKATASAKAILSIEGEQGQQAHQRAIAEYRASVTLMLVAGILGLLISVGVVVWLIRSVLPRTLAYSAFAAEVGQGDYGRRLQPGGDDELAQLGRVLDDLAERRQVDDTYDRNQLELIDTLQLAESEQEARDLLKRHLERTIADNEVTVLNRNNSADRLEAVTPVDAASPLSPGLQSAKPRSCLAVRKARPHSAAAGQDALLGCPVCSGCAGLTTCTPLIVGGEVIGSVLANHEAPLAETEQRSIREAVTQAAPVMGNLRNLAIAELRAATDSLTGLPNKRAIHDSMRRMVAHASRTLVPLAALMCDLDHFKHINDRFGHGCGDDVLAAVGAVLADSIRASDFAGRYGGEEFLILLPDTDAQAALIIAEKLRSAVAAIRVPTVDQGMTLSVGVAALPDHALDADSLVRAADRALYAAKKAGRDRVLVFTTQPEQLVAAPNVPAALS